MISHRFIRAVSLLTVSLFLLSASVDETLNRLENSPQQSQLAIYTPNGYLQAVYRGDLAQLSAADPVAMTRQPNLLRRVRLSFVHQWL